MNIPRDPGPLDLRCPYCGALPGEPCREMGSGPKRHPHGARFTKADEESQRLRVEREKVKRWER